MRWRGNVRPVVRMRSRLGDGRWTRWVKVSDYTDDGPDPGRGEPAVRGLSMPVWVGEADRVQYRLSRPVKGLRLHFVNVRGSTTPLDRVRTAVRSAAASVATFFHGHSARAAESRPAIVPRSGWHAEKCPPRAAPDYGQVKAAFIHHTVNANDYTREEAPSIVLAICRYHRNSNGWNDIGYNFLVDRFGTLYEGRAGGIDQPVVGAQAQGYNTQTTGIANIGTYSDVPQTEQALQAMAALIRWKLPLHGAPTAGATTLRSGGGDTNRYPSGRVITVDRVIGHRDTNSTECPGEMLYGQLTQLRGMVGDLSPSPVLKAPPSRARTAVAAALAPRLVRYGRRVRVSGRLRKSGGKGQAGRRVEVQTLRGSTWRTVSRLKTSRTGRFSVLLRPKVTRLVRARFRGNGTLRASASKAVQLTVLPVVSLARPPTSGSAGTRVRLAGTVRPPSKRSLVLVVQLRRGGRWQKPGYKGVRARNGQFSAAFRPGRQGRWRFYVATIADRFHGRGESRKYQLSVRR